MNTMKAVQLHAYGPTDNLRYEDVQRPTPSPGEVLVRVHAASVNPIDGAIRAGYMAQHLPLTFPWIPGRDFSGVVEATGEGVTTLQAGDEVFGLTALPGNGSYAEYVAVPATNVVPKPRTFDYDPAAALPLAALTAWQGLFGGGLDLQPGQTVLILGAAGGVGHLAVQLAKWKGARVIGAGRATHEADIRQAGADVFVDTANGLDAAGPVDAVLALIGGDVAQQAWAQLKHGDAYASTLGAPSADEATAKSARTTAVFTQANAAHLTAIAAIADQGALLPHVAQTLPLAHAAQAQELLASPAGPTGKLVLVVR